MDAVTIADINTEEEREEADDSVASAWTTKARLGSALALNVRFAEAHQATAQLLDTAQNSNCLYLTERKEMIEKNIDMERELYKAKQDLELLNTEVLQLRQCVLLTPVRETRVVLSEAGRNKVTIALRDSGRFQLSLPTGGWGHHANHQNNNSGGLDQLMNNELASIVFNTTDFSQGTMNL